MPKKVGEPGIRTSFDREAKTVTMTVVAGEGDDQKVIDRDVFDLGAVHADLQIDVALYGLSKILQDRTSDEKDKRKKLAQMSEVMDRLGEGKWEKDRVAGVAPVVSPEVEALAKLKGLSIPAAQQALRGYEKDQREKILTNPKVAELAEQIRAERAKAEKVADLSDLI